VFRLDRPLYSPVHYPGEYGFIPGTAAGDGDPLDILTLVDEPSYPGTLITARPLGALRMIDQRKPDAKILAVADRNPDYNRIHRADQLFPHVLREVEHFFEIYKHLEGKKTRIDGWLGPRQAYAIITRARQAYCKKQIPRQARHSG
jgi:inorganic pyrophosphatase